MKRIITIVLLIASYIGNSQNAKSFLNNDGQWSVAKTYPNGNPQNPSFIETRTSIYGFIGDTIINQIVWQKYYSTYDIEFQTEFIFEAYMREENGYVFAMHPDLEIDTLYNFNIQTGDSIDYDFGFGNVYLEVINIDSLLIGEHYHKRFHFEEVYFPPSELKEIWIEDIGSIHDPLFPINPKLFSTEIPDSSKLICYKIEESVLWQNPAFENCYINNVLSLNEIRTLNLDFFPNPASSQITFELPQINKESFLYIKDIFGKTIAQIPLAKAQLKTQWDCSTIPQGVYFYQTEIDGEVYRGKIVVN